MNTSSVSSSLGSFLEQQPAKAVGPNTEIAPFQEIAAEWEWSRRPSSGIDVASDASGAPAPQALATTGPSAGLSNGNPIRDSAWEIEALNPELGTSAIASLRSLFELNEVNESEVNIRYSEELAVCPGVRTWVNRYVVVDFPDGTSEKYCAEYTQKHPEYTVCSMLQHLRKDQPAVVKMP